MLSLGIAGVESVYSGAVTSAGVVTCAGTRTASCSRMAIQSSVEWFPGDPKTAPRVGRLERR
ncbi:UNVERIFIED_CONTAM: hypothetical protein Sradi_0981900 [Sesamum radiatum]|uniref:Uncharacterized protein n=1 Tax=Sesamum radiatum TaxID=300843 RepID=A0AAW2V8C2_SESRA